MTKEKIDQLLQINADKIAPEYIETIRERLANADDSVANAAFADLKSPSTSLLFSILLCGIDRMWLGEVGLGIAKLLTCGGCYIWWLIDIFSAGNRARKHNAEKILQQI